MTTRTSALTPQYTFSGNRYRNVETGRFVSSRDVRAAVDGVIAFGKAEMQMLGADLVAGRVTLAEWQNAMAEQVQLAHLANAAAARGGWAQLDEKSLDSIAGRTEKQLNYLQGFALDIESGKQALAGVERRAMMYADAARGTYEAERQAVDVGAGQTTEQNVLGSNDSCSDCLDMTALGDVPIGTLIPIGERLCGPNCQCEIVRN